MLVDEVKEILSKDVEDVIASSLSLSLLKVYSILYLYGKQPNWCEKCLTDYYNKLKKDGMERAKKLDEKIVKIKKGAIKGLTYYPDLRKHISGENITDSDAKFLLKKGWLKETDFEVLPLGYTEKKIEPKVVEKESNEPQNNIEPKQVEPKKQKQIVSQKKVVKNK